MKRFWILTYVVLIAYETLVGVGISRHGQDEPFFRLEEGVGQDQRVDFFHFWIVGKIRIDVKEDRHVHLFVRI